MLDCKLGVVEAPLTFVTQNSELDDYELGKSDYRGKTELTIVCLHCIWKQNTINGDVILGLNLKLHHITLH